jgi:hypothetical protein
MEPVLQLERSLQGELERMQMHARHGEAIHPNAARGIAEHAARGLSPAHRLVARSYDMVATLCASHAAAAQRNGCRFGSQAKLRAESVEAAEKHTKVCECIAAGCHGGTRCSVPHPAVFQCAKVVYFAAQDLMEVPYRRRSSGAIQFITRYITHITTMYGEADDDVAKIKQMVQAGTEGTPRSATAIVHFCTPLMSPSCHQPTISHLHPQVPPPPPPWLPPASRAERRLGSSAAAGAKPYSFAMPRVRSDAWDQALRPVQSRILLRCHVPAEGLARAQNGVQGRRRRQIVCFCPSRSGHTPHASLIDSSTPAARTVHHVLGLAAIRSERCCGS